MTEQDRQLIESLSNMTLERLTVAASIAAHESNWTEMLELYKQLSEINSKRKASN